MRMSALVLALSLSMTAPAVAQEWELYQSLEDTFEVLFPGTPTITETTYTSSVDYVLPGACVQRREGPWALLDDRCRLQRSRGHGHRSFRDV